MLKTKIKRETQSQEPSLGLPSTKGSEEGKEDQK